MADCDFEVVDSSDPELPLSDDDSSEEEEEEEQEEKEQEGGNEKEELDYKMVFLVRKDLNMSGGKVAAQVSHAVHRLLGKAYRDTQEYKLQEKDVLRELASPDTEADGVENRSIDHTSFKDNSSFRNVLLWEHLGCKKITLQVESFEQLLEIRKKTRASGFTAPEDAEDDAVSSQAATAEVVASVSAGRGKYNMQQDLIIPTATIRDAGHTEVEPGTCTVLGLGPCKSSVLDPFTGHLKSFKMKSPGQYEKDKEKIEKRFQQDLDKQSKKIESLEKQLKKAKADEAQLLNVMFKGLQ